MSLENFQLFAIAAIGLAVITPFVVIGYTIIKDFYAKPV